MSPHALLLLALLSAAPVKAPMPSPAWKTTPLPPSMPKPVEEGTVDVEGAKLWFAVYGEGAPVVLLHGGAGNSEHWSLQVPALAKHFQVLVLDSRGHGRSTRDGRAYSYHQMAEDVVALLDHRKLAKASLVGWSDGGAIALDLAIHHPGRVEKLVPFATNYDLTGMRSAGGPHATFATYLQRCTADYERLSATPKEFQGFMDELRKMWRSQPQFTKAQLAAITAPTLILDGDHDEIIKQDHVKELARLIPGARVQLISEASHFAHWQRPEAFNAAVLSFLQGAPK